MKAFVLTRYGNNQEIQAADMPEPLVNAEDVLIQVKAASVNPVDFKIRDGQLKQVLPLRFPPHSGQRRGRRSDAGWGEGDAV
ncbi:hypothetical protein LRS06_21235 [Hymenobacter sp. J193]|uniref:hypothetical protein n=1 Tax=Hymenobacter sp. J193 TaxID=2898429 RepID=UPI0021509D76|nr:hypothetical protein [Hymenobacter sp. J193]MCR5890254.1 hypothetical protein [Hymenobacter sp. J193]